MSQNTATIQQIASAAGVTDVTVSRILTGSYRAKRPDAVRRADRIRRLAEQMGYRPSAAARATRTGRTGYIGMIRSPSLSLSVHAPVFDMAIDEALHHRDLCLVRDVIDDLDDQPPRIVRENAVDGLIINYAFGTPARIREILDRSRMPALWVNRKRDANCVYPNDKGASADATRFLIERGHRRVAFLQIPLHQSLKQRNIEPHYSIVDRCDGYESTMHAAGATPHVEVLPMPEDLQSLKAGWLLQGCIAFLKKPDRPTAVFCDFNGRTMLHAAEICRLRVPQDISVIAFDNDAGADERVAVDRVLVPYRPMADTAVAELCELIEQPTQQRPPVKLPFEFHRTGTVAAV